MSFIYNIVKSKGTVFTRTLKTTTQSYPSLISKIKNDEVEEPYGKTKITKLEMKDWKHDSVRTGILGIKKGMTRVWDDWGVLIPCTVIQVIFYLILD